MAGSTQIAQYPSEHLCSIDYFLCVSIYTMQEHSKIYLCHFAILGNFHSFYYCYRVYKNHLKMVKGCRIDVGLCKKDPPKTHGTRIICETSAGLGGQRARRA